MKAISAQSSSQLLSDGTKKTNAPPRILPKICAIIYFELPYLSSPQSSSQTTSKEQVHFFTKLYALPCLALTYFAVILAHGFVSHSWGHCGYRCFMVTFLIQRCITDNGTKINVRHYASLGELFKRMLWHFRQTSYWSGISAMECFARKGIHSKALMMCCNWLASKFRYSFSGIPDQ